MDVKKTKREVIERKLLTSLYEEGNVAALFGFNDLDTLVQALRFVRDHQFGLTDKEQDLLSGLEELQRQSFPDQRSTITKEADGWYWMDETWMGHGPYKSRSKAVRDQAEYAENL